MKFLTLGAAFALLAGLSSGDTPSSEPSPGRPALSPFEQTAAHALQHNPGLTARRNRADAAFARIPQARSLPNPQFALTVFGEEVQTRTGPQEHILSLQQRFPWFGTLTLKSDRASAEARAEAYAAQAAELVLIQHLATTYAELGHLTRAEALTAENLQLLQETEPIVRQQVRGGTPLNALLRLHVEIATLSDRLSQLQRDRHSRAETLRSLLSLPPDAPLPLPEWDPETETDPARLTLSPRHPELNRLREKREAARTGIRLAERSAYPELFVGASYIQVGDPSVNPATPGAGEDPWNLTAGISIPLWRDRIRAQQTEARSLHDAAGQDLAQKTNELQQQLATRILEHRDAHRRITLYSAELLPLARQAAENSRAAYPSGQIGILELIDSERTLLDLRILAGRAEADAFRTRIHLQTLTHPESPVSP